MGQLDGVSEGEVFEVIWKLLDKRHLRASHQHGHHRDIATKGRGQLNPHKVASVVQATYTEGISAIEPFLADHCEKEGAVCHALIDGFAEVAARLDAGDI